MSSSGSSCPPMVFAIAAPARQGSAAEGPIYCPLAIPAALATLFRLCELSAHALRLSKIS